MVKIGNIDLGTFPLLLAPMEDVSDPPFRALCKQQGADMMYTEFISSEGLIRNAAKSTMKLDIYEKERPVGIQIFGANLESMLKSVEIVEKSIQKYGSPVYVRHEIVHNKHVVDNLKNKGAIFVEELEEINDKSRPVIFSAHGVPKKIPEDAENYKMTYVDATCPLVSKVHREAENLYKAGYHIVLIGHENHPEVIGTMGQLPKGSIDLVQNEAEAMKYKKDNYEKLAYITQTTLSVDDTKEIINILKNKFSNIREPAKEDICYATTNRQMAVKNIAKKCDIFFVIGSRNSSNSVRLVEVAKKSGCQNSQLFHSESEIPFDQIQNSNTIGISSGASAPEILVENFISELKKKFSINVEEVEIIKENVVFKVPKKLN